MTKEIADRIDDEDSDEEIEKKPLKKSSKAKSAKKRSVPKEYPDYVLKDLEKQLKIHQKIPENQVHVNIWGFQSFIIIILFI